MNIDLAHKLAGAEKVGDRSFWRGETLIEIGEAVLLALVAVATAWSGYHAARWDGQQALLYGTSAGLRTEAAVAATEGGQQRLLDVVTFNTWIDATRRQDKVLAEVYVHRFSPEYRIAFDAWLKREPFTRSDAPPGPSFMPEYHNALLAHSAQLDGAANSAFQRGMQARATSEKYVRTTLLLATILFVVTLAQRFKTHKVRYGLLLVAATVMAYTLTTLATFARL